MIGYARASLGDQTLELQRDCSEGRGLRALSEVTPWRERATALRCVTPSTICCAGVTLVAWGQDRIARSLKGLMRCSGVQRRSPPTPEGDACTLDYLRERCPAPNNPDATAFATYRC